MIYTSHNGCFYYYDSVLYRWQIAEPSLLFLLGLEAVTSYSKSQSDVITISKYAYNYNSDSLYNLKYIDEIYDSVYSFLSKIGSVEDYESYLKFNCYGLKLLLNDITGTGDDRTVPIIFKNDTNRSLIDSYFNSDRVRSYQKYNYSYFDLQAKLIYDIFNDAYYNLTLERTSSTGQKIAEYYLDKGSDELSYISDLQLSDQSIIRNDINTYNNTINNVHNVRLSNSNSYNLLDYKSMYSYALGVLYGCRCIGYDDSVIWRLDPKYWYNNKYVNLVRTAWYVFRFYWVHTSTDISQFNQEPQDNKIWNFNNSQSLINEPISGDESGAFCLYLDNNVNASESIIYSFTKHISDSCTNPGAYLTYSVSQNDLEWSWLSIDDKVSNGDSSVIPNIPEKGVISVNDAAMVRYIGNDKVIIYKAFHWHDSNGVKYLSPSYIDGSDTVYKKYYVYTGSLGWVNYNENILIDTDNSHDTSYDYLYIVPRTVSVDKLSYAMLRNPTDDVPSVVTYYKCNVTDDRSLYGIYNSYIRKPTGNMPKNFDQIISDKLFETNYTTSISDPNTQSEYSIKSYYNLNKSITLLTKTINGHTYIWDGDNSIDDKDIFYYGYSSTPSSVVTLYASNSDHSLESPTEVAFRYNPDYNKYWSTDFFNSVHSGNSRTWEPKTTLINLSDELTPLYTVTTKQINIYRNESIIFNSAKVYVLYKDKLSNNNTYSEYVYLDKSTFDAIYSNAYFDFIILGDSTSTDDNLYKRGYTQYPCDIITSDDNGNSLLDDNGNPLVWYDRYNQLYWNGVNGINRWQSQKPTRSQLYMWDTSTSTLSPVYLDEESHTITVDDVQMTSDEFYNGNRGIIQDKLNVVNNSSDGMITCYCDYVDDQFGSANDIYCIPNITNTWVSRSDISNIYHYWFVDGTTLLYNGSNSEDIIIDDDNTD